MEYSPTFKTVKRCVTLLDVWCQEFDTYILRMVYYATKEMYFKSLWKHNWNYCAKYVFRY
jgi:hypothetical protein